MKLWASCLLLFSTVASADVGRITEITGAAIIKRDAATITATLDMPIKMADRIETRGGVVSVTFADDTKIKITESSAVVIDEFTYDPATKSGKLSARAAGGTVRYTSGAIAKNPKNVNLRTPTATIAVRGTDFVMSVSESGSSMIILMPSCESNPAQGNQCGSGAIDVSTGGGNVSMNRPYQATLVESGHNPPSPPITVDLSTSGVSNNLQISPPRTSTGQNIVAAAREAAGKTGDLGRRGSDRQAEEAKTAEAASSDGESPPTVNPEATANQVAGISGTTNPYLWRLWGDRSQTKQIGWLWEQISESQRSYVNVIQDMTTQSELVVSQDGLITSYNFSPGRAQGTITVIQVNR